MGRVPIEGALALVTGAGSGIGRATALALAGRGARVLCADVDLASAEKVAAACGERGPSGEGHRVDVADAGSLLALAAAVHEQHGPLDILVNNAGVGMTGRFAEMTLDDWAWIRAINLDGVIQGCHAFGPAMADRGRGHVVNVSSGLGYTPRATEPAYVTTKAAVLAFSQCLRADWSRRGVGVSAICPGVINTPIVDRTKFLGTQAAKQERTTKVFRRGHKPEKVAAAIVRAIERDRAVVPVGAEARVGWWIHRWAPIGFQQFIARQETR